MQGEEVGKESEKTVVSHNGKYIYGAVCRMIAVGMDHADCRHSLEVDRLLGPSLTTSPLVSESPNCRGLGPRQSCRVSLLSDRPHIRTEKPGTREAVNWNRGIRARRSVPWATPSARTTTRLRRYNRSVTSPRMKSTTRADPGAIYPLPGWALRRRDLRQKCPCWRHERTRTTRRSWP